uniref:Uncharacterized protein n=1 Tax=Ditylenchus dipsaci TaxID=166011 RepID=A0A915DCS9_9BILA
MAEQKTNAEEAMKNGMELKKKVSVLLNKAEDIKFQAESANAIVAIDAGTPDLKTFLTDVQTGIDTAREKFYAADLEIEADSQQKDVSSKLTAYENNHKQKMEDAIKLKSTDEAVVIESKRECQEALKLARELKYEAESARSLATSLVAAAAIVENSQASAGDKQTALAAKNKAENEVIKLLDVILLPVDTAKIPDAITKATEGRANIAKLFAALPFTAKKPVDDEKQTPKIPKQQMKTKLRLDKNKRKLI